MRSRTILSVLCIVALFAVPASAQSGMQTGTADLQSAGILAFGTDGVLFVGDSMGAAIYALDTGDNTAGAAQRVDIQGIDMQVAAMLGTAPDQILINDMAVNPISKNVYLSVSRGTGPDAMPVILRVTASGSIDELSLDNIAHSKVMLPNAPAGGGQASRAPSG